MPTLLRKFVTLNSPWKQIVACLMCLGIVTVGVLLYEAVFG